MAKYRIQIEGYGIDIVQDESEERIHSFVATRLIQADSPRQASEEALRSVRADWTLGMFGGPNAMPKLRVTRTEPAQWWHSLVTPYIPYVFSERELQVDDAGPRSAEAGKDIAPDDLVADKGPPSSAVAVSHGRRDETLILGLAIVFLVAAVALAVNPIRLVLYGESADGTVTNVIRETVRNSDGKDEVRSTATIRYKAGDRDASIERSTSQPLGSYCFVGCYSRGERLKILYLVDDWRVAEVFSFAALFGLPVAFGLAASMGIFIWRLMRSRRLAVKI